MNTGCDWEFQKPVRPGDVIHLTESLDRLEHRAGAHIGPYVLCYGTKKYTDPAGDLFARCTIIVSRFLERAVERRSIRYGRPGDYADYYSPDRPVTWREPHRRGPEPLYFEDVADGEDVPALVKGPLSVQEIVAHIWMHRVPYNQPGRWEFPYAERPGRIFWAYTPTRSWALRAFPNAFAYAAYMESALGQMLTNWIGDSGWLWKLGTRLRRPTFSGDVSVCRGKVTAKHTTSDGKNVVDLEVTAETKRCGVTTFGTASVVLPSRAKL